MVVEPAGYTPLTQAELEPSADVTQQVYSQYNLSESFILCFTFHIHYFCSFLFLYNALDIYTMVVLCRTNIDISFI